MLLHKISDSPFQSTKLNNCLTLLSDKDAILLTQDAVYALQHPSLCAQLCQLENPVYVLTPDSQARAILVSSAFIQIDYADFVALSLTFNQVISW